MFLKELYAYRYLLREIVAKNIKIQYRNSVLGVFWTLLEPLLTTLVLVFVFSAVFTRSDRVVAEVINFPIYLLCGRLLYDFYSKATKRAMRSVTGSASVLKKVKVPKYIYPLANVLSTFVTFMISLVVLVGFAVFFFVVNSAQNPPPVLSRYLLLAPIPMVILFILCTGVGLIMSTLAVFFKDMEYLYDVFCMMLFYATPIIWVPAMVNATQRPMMMAVLHMNPLYSIIEMFRNCVLRGKPIHLPHLYTALGISLLLLVIGVLLFKKKQDKFVLHI